jgi:hypothetical protein
MSRRRRRRIDFFLLRFSFLRWLVRKGRCEAELCDSQNEITSWLRAFSSMDQ